MRTQAQTPPDAPAAARVEGILIGWLTSLGPDGAARILAPDLSDAPLAARSLCVFGPEQVGAPCALLFEQGDPGRPLILGVVRLPVHTPQTAPAAPDLHLEGRDEVVLRCGKASITLTREGRIILRGSYVLTRSTGANRIQGSSIQLN